MYWNNQLSGIWNGDKNISKYKCFVGVEVISIVQIAVPALQRKKPTKRSGILLH